MQNQAFGISDVGQMRKELQILHKFAAGIKSAFNAKDDHSTKALF